MKKIIDFGSTFLIADKIVGVSKEGETRIQFYAAGLMAGLNMNYDSREQRDKDYNEIKKSFE